MTKKQTKNKRDNKKLEQQLETKRKEELNMTKTLNEIEKEFETLLMKNKKDIETVEQELEIKQKELNKLKGDLEKAEQSINIAEFEKINKNLWIAEQTAKMLTKKLNKLKNEPIITKEQFNEYENEIQKSYQLERKEPRKIFDTLKPTLKEAITKDAETRNKGYKLLDDLMYTLVRNEKEYLKVNGGYRSFSSSLQNDNTTLIYEVREFARCVLD